MVNYEDGKKLEWCDRCTGVMKNGKCVNCGYDEREVINMEKKVTLSFEKETKRMVRYVADDERFGTLYLPKAIFPEDEYPDTVTMTLAW